MKGLVHAYLWEKEAEEDPYIVIYNTESLSKY
jgi:hypothetical protein